MISEELELRLQRVANRAFDKRGKLARLHRRKATRQIGKFIAAQLGYLRASEGSAREAVALEERKALAAALDETDIVWGFAIVVGLRRVLEQAREATGFAVARLRPCVNAERLVRVLRAPLINQYGSRGI
jgi:hypothetical protein